MIERIAVDHTFPTQISRWNQLTKEEQWRLTILLTPDRKQCIAFGCKPGPNPKLGGRK